MYTSKALSTNERTEARRIIDEEMTVMKTTLLAAGIGAEIHGVDLSKPMPESTFTYVRDAWLDHGVLLFRDQHLNHAQLGSDLALRTGVPGQVLGIRQRDLQGRQRGR